MKFSHYFVFRYINAGAARTLFIPGNTNPLGRSVGEYLQRINPIDLDPLSAGTAFGNLHNQHPTTARIFLGNGTEPEALRILHDQLLMDIVPPTNEINENIDGTKIYMTRTPLARWMEESTVLDGPYVHDTVLAMKSKISEPLEKQYESELQVARTKKAKDEDERKKRAEEKARQEAERAQVAAAAAADTTAPSTTEETSDTTVDPCIVTATDTTIASSGMIEEIHHVNDIVMTSPEQQHPTRVSPIPESIPDIHPSLEHRIRDEAGLASSQTTGKSSIDNILE